MKKSIYLLLMMVSCYFISCQSQADQVIGAGPTNGKIIAAVSPTDPYNPVFTATSENGFIYHWDMGNGQKITPGKNAETSYYPFSGTYNIACTIYGEGAQQTEASTTFTVVKTDPNVATRPVWKELTGGGAGKTWVYNTDLATGTPDYCFQTTFNLADYPDNWKPANSWGQCVRITPDINGEMVFDLNDGINFTYHHEAGDTGEKGTFILDADKMTITIKSPFILDHAIDCTKPSANTSGVYEIKLLTEDEMVLWQDQKDGETGWSWSFKRKGYTP